MSCISFGCVALLFIALEVIGFELLEHTSKTGFLAHRDLLFLLVDCQWELFRSGFLGWVPGMILEGVTLHDSVGGRVQRIFNLGLEENMQKKTENREKLHMLGSMAKMQR